MSRRKRLILKLTGVLLLILLVCTFLSRSIYQLLLPEVTLGEVTRGSVVRKSYATGTLEATDQQIIRAETTWKVTEVLAENGTPVTAGTPVLRVDTTAFQIEEKQLLISRQEIENTEVWGSKAREQKEARLELYDLQLQELRNSIPSDGLVKADRSGTLSGLTVQAGETLLEGDVAFYLTPEDTNYEIQIVLEMEEGTEFRQGAAAYAAMDVLEADTIEGKEVVKTERVSCSIAETTLMESGEWTFVLIPEEIPEGVTAGQSVQVTLSSSSVTYNTVIPASAVISQPDGSYIVFVAETRAGLFGQELVATGIPVTIERTNGLSTAVTGNLYFPQQVVTSTTSPLKDGDSIKVSLS